VHLCAPDDVALARLYSHALAFVLPSRGEGFGLPSIEAMACGCPVVLARAGALPEVGGDVAQYVEPGDTAQLTSVLDQLVADDDLRRTLGAQGIAHAATYTWQATAAMTAQHYRSLG